MFSCLALIFPGLNPRAYVQSSERAKETSFFKKLEFKDTGGAGLVMKS